MARPRVEVRPARCGDFINSVGTIFLHHPTDHTKSRHLSKEHISEIEALHVEVLREGKLVYELPTMEEIRQNRKNDLDKLDSGVRRLLTPHMYHVSLTESLWELKQELIRSATD